MPLFEEDPAHLSKSRLRSDLVAHNVALPPAKSKKEVYVELYLKHIDQKNAADFSSDEEDRGQDVSEEDPDDAEIPDPSGLTDDDLRAALVQHGIKAGPVVASTRALYETKLRKLLQADGLGCMNGEEKGVIYSDSEEEEEEEEEEEGSAGAKEEAVEQSDQTQQSSQNCGFVYPQCFLPSSRLRASRNKKTSPNWNSENALKSSVDSCRSQCSKIPVGISRASSVDQRSGLGPVVPSGSQSALPNGCSSFSSQAFSITQMVEEMESRRSLSASTDTERELNKSNVKEYWLQSNRLDIVDKHTMKSQSLYYTPEASPYERGLKIPLEPVKAILKDLFPDCHTTPTGIYATRRRPIKGAAGRPIEYAYPDTPVSPTTLERREVERRLVPIHIQIIVFLAVVVLLYLINFCSEDSSFSPLVALLDSLNQGSDSEDGLLLQDETQDTPVL
uniref:LEM domain-containing protein 1 isoform X3 n=1 Tax=Scatophagus argus TaxID=75038 RepID=UPI001ED8649B|nr:LEM domain-containing protein 1 isoform X3 [Scatophagus argus]